MRDGWVPVMLCVIACLLLYANGCVTHVKVEDARRFEFDVVACVTVDTCKALVGRMGQPVSVAVDPEQ